MRGGALILIVAVLACVSVSVCDNNGVRGEKVKDEEALVSCQNAFLQIFIDISKQLTREAGEFVKDIHIKNKMKVKTKGILKDYNLKSGIMDDPITNADKLSNYILLS